MIEITFLFKISNETNNNKIYYLSYYNLIFQTIIEKAFQQLIFF